MPHRSLRRSGGDARLAKVTPEGVAQGVNVDRPSPFVPFGDSGQFQVTIENPHQPGRNVEQRRIGRQPCRNRLVAASGFALEGFELVIEPFRLGLPQRRF